LFYEIFTGEWNCGVKRGVGIGEGIEEEGGEEEDEKGRKGKVEG